jgi:hypothetical protein
MKPSEHTTSQSCEPTVRLISSWVTSLYLVHQRLSPFKTLLTNERNTGMIE